MNRTGKIIFDVPNNSSGFKLFITDKVGNNYLVDLKI